MTKGIVIAAPKSGSGKTTISLSLMAAFSRRGLRVAPFKIGPDFIDPGHHTRITGKVSRNLDGWMLSKETNVTAFACHSRDYTDIAIVEGVMGLFDGYDGVSEAGSTAQMAKWLDLPVLLVVDAKSMARSAAALVYGFETFDTELTFAGVLFNNVASTRHLRYLEDAVKAHTNIPCLGGVMRDNSISIPSRHLGLVTQDEYRLSKQHIINLANLVERAMDLQALIDNLPEISCNTERFEMNGPNSKRSVNIGIARDAAFCFYYPENLELLEQSGAVLTFFSPISDKKLPEGLDGVYFGGGYPELFAKELETNSAMRHAVRQACLEQMPIYSECGGFMYLCKTLHDVEGAQYRMTGCFPFKTQMSKRLRVLGYREVTLTEKTLLGEKGSRIRGHEFHYSEKSANDALPVKTVYAVTPRAGTTHTNDGYMINQTLGSYHHLHFGSNPQVAQHFTDACRRYQQRKGKQS